MTQRPEHDRKTEVNVCLASLSFYPLYVGPALRFLRYSPGLASRGVTMQVFTQKPTPDLIARDGVLSSESRGDSGYLKDLVGRLEVHRAELPSGRLRRRAYYQQLVDHCSRSNHPAQVVQLLNLDPLGLGSLQKLRKLGFPTVFTYTLLSDPPDNPIRRFLQKRYLRMQLNSVDCVVVSSSAMREQVKSLGVTVPVLIIPNGVDLARFRPADDQETRRELRRQLGLQTEGQLILSIGPISPRKGTDALVRAFCKLAGELPSARLVLVGPRHDQARQGLSDFHERIQSDLRTSGVADRVTFTGPKTRVADYLRAADLFVFPSRREGMPNVVPEAMASGVPVVLTPFIGFCEELGRADQQYLLSDWAPERLSSDMMSLLTDGDRARSLGKAGRTWVERNLDVEKSLDAYASLYRGLRLLESGNRARHSLTLETALAKSQ